MLENDIFKKCVFQEDKLLQFGFQLENESYVYREDILDGEFEIIVTVKDNSVKGRIIEKDMNEEYFNFRVENQVGEFVNTIKEEFVRVLNHIKEKCTLENLFVYEQSNRISRWIKEEFHDDAEYLWETDDNAVFRNKNNKKWYGIIMYISKKKIADGDYMVEVMNVKLPADLISNLVKKEGFYPAYHMNKKYWITILLDDTISDDEIQSLIRKSYEYTVETRDWVIPANPLYWDIVHCFDYTNTIEWKAPNSINDGDSVYIYVGKPYSCLMYHCRVLSVDSTGIMKIELVERFSNDKYPFELLKEYDLRAIRGARRIPIKLLSLLKKEC